MPMTFHPTAPSEIAMFGGGLFGGDRGPGYNEHLTCRVPFKSTKRLSFPIREYWEVKEDSDKEILVSRNCIWNSLMSHSRRILRRRCARPGQKSWPSGTCAMCDAVFQDSPVFHGWTS